MLALLAVVPSACNNLLDNEAWTLATDASGPIQLGPGDAGADVAPVEAGGWLGRATGRRRTRSRQPDGTTGPVDSDPTPWRSPDGAPDTNTTGLDPRLVVPSASAPTRSVINSPQACPNYGFGAIAGRHDAGRCTDCMAQGSCSGPQVRVRDQRGLDDIFQCYCGHAWTLCLIGMECGSMCVSVGNDTWGVCMN